MLLVPRGVQASIHWSNTVSGESMLEDAWMASHQLLLLVSNLALLWAHVLNYHSCPADLGSKQLWRYPLMKTGSSLDVCQRALIFGMRCVFSSCVIWSCALLLSRLQATVVSMS